MALIEALAPEVVRELEQLVSLAAHGAPAPEIATQAEKFATLAAYKASYRSA